MRGPGYVTEDLAVSHCCDSLVTHKAMALAMIYNDLANAQVKWCAARDLNPEPAD